MVAPCERHATAAVGIRHKENDSGPRGLGACGIHGFDTDHILSTGIGLCFGISALPNQCDGIAVRVGAGGRNRDRRSGCHTVAVRRSGNDRRCRRRVCHSKGLGYPLRIQTGCIPGANTNGMGTNGIVTVRCLVIPLQRGGIAVRISGCRTDIHKEFAAFRCAGGGCSQGDRGCGAGDVEGLFCPRGIRSGNIL